MPTFWDIADLQGIQQGLADIAARCREIGRSRCHSGIVVLRGRQARRCAGLCRARTTYRAAGTSQFLFDFPISAEGLDAARRVATDLILPLHEELA